MDFGFDREQEKLRREVRDFYLSELPTDYERQTPALNEKSQSFWLELQRKAGAKGYLTPGWPKEYGGLGLGSIEQGIIQEEEGYAGITWPNNIGYSLAGPAVILFGTEEQKKKFIPPITEGKVVWFEAFTEPEAGSDEANVQLRAVKDGDDYVLNGQKVFISGTYKPNYLYTLARTADVVPKHRGLSLFLVPADTPGISYRPLPTMMSHAQNEIFFDGARVSKDFLLGEVNRGFYHAMATFEFERTGTGWPARSKQNLDDFVQFCKETKRDGKFLIEDPKVRDELAQMAVEAEVWRLIAWEMAWWFGERERLGPKKYDLSGYFWKVVPGRHAEAMTDILGLYGQLRTGSNWSPLAGKVERGWQAGRSSHAGGTMQIVKVVLAQRGLGLPRIPANIMSEIGKAVKEAER